MVMNPNGMVMTERGLMPAWQVAQMRQQQQSNSPVEQSNRANQQRYDDILGEMKGMGEQAGADIGDRFQKMRQQKQQWLGNRGLSGTTLSLGNYSQQEEAERRRLSEQLRRERLGFMERRNDVPVM